MFIEFPGSAVQERERAALLDLDGISVLLLSPEDMIIDRLAAWQFWNSTTDGASAFLIWRPQETRLDHARLDGLARKRGVVKGLARLEAFVRNLGGRTPSAEELESWANLRP